jgi:hypothetical protein
LKTLLAQPERGAAAPPQAPPALAALPRSFWGARPRAALTAAE